RNVPPHIGRPRLGDKLRRTGRIRTRLERAGSEPCAGETAGKFPVRRAAGGRRGIHVRRSGGRTGLPGGDAAVASIPRAPDTLSAIARLRPKDGFYPTAANLICRHRRDISKMKSRTFWITDSMRRCAPKSSGTWNHAWNAGANSRPFVGRSYLR